MVNPLTLQKISAGDVIVEDEFADFLHVFGMSLVSHRCRRGLWMLGWPSRLFGLLRKDTDECRNLVHELREDEQNYQTLHASEVSGPFGEAIKKRHLMQLTCNRQFVEAFTESAWEVKHPSFYRILEVLRRRARLHWGTLTCEEVLASMKNTPGRKNRKFRKPEVITSYGIRGKVLERRCNYIPVKLDKPLASKQARVPLDAWRPHVKTRSINFNDIVGKGEQTKWHSPTAQNLSAPVADLHVLREFKVTGGQAGRYEQLETCGWVLCSMCGTNLSSGGRIAQTSPDGTWPWTTLMAVV